MTASMTAFARQDYLESWGQLSCELRSLNHRYLELVFRLPDAFRQIEPQCREAIANKIARGKVEISIKFRPLDENTISNISLNTPIAKKLLQITQEIRELDNSPSSLEIATLLKWPGLVSEDPPNLDSVFPATIKLLEKTLEELATSRQREGKKLAELIEKRLQDLNLIVENIHSALPEIEKTQQEKMHNKLMELSENIETSRVEQEIAILLQKMDIHEELDRIVTHSNEVSRLLKETKPVGRRLDFLMQELNREANTMGSKSVSETTTKAAIELKVLIEQMREQIQNIE